MKPLLFSLLMAWVIVSNARRPALSITIPGLPNVTVLGGLNWYTPQPGEEVPEYLLAN
jgi:hypothetical protein